MKEKKLEKGAGRLRGMAQAAGRAGKSLVNAVPAPVRAVAVAVGVGSLTSVARAQTSSFDVSTLYTGVAAVFTAAATIAGGFLAIKFGAKMVKKAWAWLT